MSFFIVNHRLVEFQQNRSSIFHFPKILKFACFLAHQHCNRFYSQNELVCRRPKRPLMPSTYDQSIFFFFTAFRIITHGNNDITKFAIFRTDISHWSRSQPLRWNKNSPTSLHHHFMILTNFFTTNFLEHPIHDLILSIGLTPKPKQSPCLRNEQTLSHTCSSFRILSYNRHDAPLDFHSRFSWDHLLFHKTLQSFKVTSLKSWKAS